MICEPRPSRSLQAGVLLGALALFIGLSGCATTSGKAENRASERRAQELGLSADALDPTVRDKREGYGRWKQKPDPVGSDSPLSPDRRPWAERP